MKSQSEVGKAALERCPYCHTAYVDGCDDVCPKAPERHSFMVFNSKTDKTCIRCGQTDDVGNHYTEEDAEKILERRRAIMPDYDKKLEEWLS